MKKIIYVLVLLFHFSFAGAQNTTSVKISKKISKSESSLVPKRAVRQMKGYDKLRQELDFINLLNVDLQKDTVFILQSYSFSNLNDGMYISFWNSRKQFSFYQKGNSLDYGRKPLCAIKEGYEHLAFSNYMRQLVSEWNIEGLRREGKINGVLGVMNYVAIRIIFKNKKYKIKSISFEDFYSPERDYYPYLHLINDDPYTPVYESK